MGLHLVQHRLHLHVHSQVYEVVGIEIRHANATQFTFLVGFLQGTIGSIAVAERLVQQHQVDIICLQLAQTLVNRCLCLLVAIVGNPYLRYEEDILAINAALLPCTTYTFFIGVSLSRVYHPIAHLQCIAHATFTLIRCHLIHAVTNLRHFNAIVKLDCIHCIIIF